MRYGIDTEKYRVPIMYGNEFRTPMELSDAQQEAYGWPNVFSRSVALLIKHDVPPSDAYWIVLGICQANDPEFSVISPFGDDNYRCMIKRANKYFKQGKDW